jgi:hypothetical protein
MAKKAKAPSTLRTYIITRARRLSDRIRKADPTRYRNSLVEIRDAVQEALDHMDEA